MRIRAEYLGTARVETATVGKIASHPLRLFVSSVLVMVFVLFFIHCKSILVFSSPPASGDWFVTETESYYDEVIVLNGNLVVESGGNLTFRKVTLKMNCTYSGQYNIRVASGGQFYVLEGSVITSADPDKRIGIFWVSPGSTFVMNNSELHGSEYLRACTGDAIVENSLISYNRGGIRIEMDGVVIRNNNISQNDDMGITVHLCSPTIYNNTITNSGCGINIFGKESTPIIEDNVITLNEDIGIACNHNCSPIIQGNNISSNGQGIGLQLHSTGIIQGNLIASNGNVHAIIFEDAANLTIQDNVIIKNWGGISFWNSSSIISGNFIAENLHSGIQCFDYCSSTIVNNTVTSNLGDGISLLRHSDATIQGNNITLNNGNGIAFREHCTGIIQGNIVTKNSFGIQSFYSNPLIQGNIITSNWVSGILCMNSSLPEIHWNDIHGNECGVENDDPSVTVNATHNHWGNGPSTHGEVLATPWLTESIFQVEITSPLSGETVSSTVTVSTEVDARSGVHKVEFYIDDQREYTDYDASYEWNWDTTEYTETEHVITAKAYDTLGLKISTSITIFVDNTAPAVSIKEPKPENTYSGTVSVSVNATDNRELANVHVKVDNTDWLVMTYDPIDLLWKYDLNTTTFSDGQHTLMVLALDEASNPTTASTTLFFDNTPPTLTIQTPQSGTTVGMTLIVDIQANDASGISRIEFYVQNVLVHTVTETPYQWSWDTTKYPNGEYRITVKAYDAFGRVNTSQTIVTVENVQSPWWQTHLWTIIEVFVAIGGLMLGIIAYLTRKREKKN